jgi:D-tyrosyl-tRNA(Tyr) deacylase
MIAVVQRCSRGEVRVEGESVGSLAANGGLVVLVGVETDDSADHARKLGDKIAKLRVFEDDAGKMNRSVQDVGGSVPCNTWISLKDPRGGTKEVFAHCQTSSLDDPPPNVVGLVPSEEDVIFEVQAQNIQN